jgi:hypothetical protein
VLLAKGRAMIVKGLNTASEKGTVFNEQDDLSEQVISALGLDVCAHQVDSIKIVFDWTSATHPLAVYINTIFDGEIIKRYLGPDYQQLGDMINAFGFDVLFARQKMTVEVHKDGFVFCELCFVPTAEQHASMIDALGKVNA